MKRLHLNLLLVLAILVAASLPGSQASAAKPCLSNAQCSSSQYCAKAEGNCGGAGTCTAKPTVCPFVCGQVCGCDGLTYCNSCLAAEAGVNTAHNGAC